MLGCMNKQTPARALETRIATRCAQLPRRRSRQCSWSALRISLSADRGDQAAVGFDLFLQAHRLWVEPTV